MDLPAGRCGECGFDPPTVSPADAGVAARSYPRRFRALLVRPDDEDPDIVHRRPAPGQPSAVDHAAAAAAGLAWAAEGVRRVLVQDDAAVEAPPSGADAGGQPLEAVLDRVVAGAGDLAAAIESARGTDWARAGQVRGGGPVGALDVARAGVHAGIHHLRAAERTLAAVR